MCLLISQLRRLDQSRARTSLTLRSPEIPVGFAARISRSSFFFILKDYLYNCFLAILKAHLRFLFVCEQQFGVILVYLRFLISFGCSD